MNNNIFLFNDDCRNILSLLPENKIDCVITDPPYFLDGMGDNWQIDKMKDSAAKAKVVQSMPVGMRFDPKQGIELQAFMENISKDIYRILKPGGFYLAFA